MAETGFWDKVPFINMGVVDNRFKKMVKDIFAVYNQILSEKAYDDIIFDLSKSWTKGLFSWCIVPAAFNKNKDKLERLMSEIEKKGADGLELETREFKESTRAARMITYYGYTLLMAIEDVWKLIREEKIKNIEEVVIPQIKQRIQYYLSGRRRNNH